MLEQDLFTGLCKIQNNGTLDMKESEGEILARNLFESWTKRVSPSLLEDVKLVFTVLSPITKQYTVMWIVDLNLKRNQGFHQL